MTTACRKAKESSLHNPASRFPQTYKSSRRALLRTFPYSAGFARGRNRAQRRIGWVMAMVYDDHNPPHFHAEYGEHEVLVSISTLDILSGSLPARALGLVTESASLHVPTTRPTGSRRSPEQDRAGPEGTTR